MAAYDKEKSSIELPVEEFLSIMKGIESEYSTELARGVSDRIAEVKSDHGRKLAYMTLEEFIQGERDEAHAEDKAEGRAHRIFCSAIDRRLLKTCYVSLASENFETGTSMFVGLAGF